MEQLIYFHDHALMIILIIITTVFYTPQNSVSKSATKESYKYSLMPNVLILYGKCHFSLPTGTAPSV
jgi:hypothetical protein